MAPSLDVELGTGQRTPHAHGLTVGSYDMSGAGRLGIVATRAGLSSVAVGRFRRCGGMFGNLTLVVPLGFAAALSPMMLTEQTVLLAGRDGRRSASRYALGTAVVTTVYLGVLVLWGHTISLPKRPTLSASMDIVAGVVLVLIAVAIQVRQPARSKKPTRTEMGPRAAFGFGVFSMATNFTSLAVLVPAAKDVAADVANVFGRVALIAVLVVLATMPAWVPLAATGVAAGTAKRGLDWLSNLISQNGRRIAVILIAALGVVLIARGCWHILR